MVIKHERGALHQREQSLKSQASSSSLPEMLQLGLENEIELDGIGRGSQCGPFCLSANLFNI